MKITAKHKMDLAQPNSIPPIHCVQGDAFSRRVELELLDKGEPWSVPEGTALQISYRRPDGVCGTYTQTPDGSTAWEISQNIAAIELIPQMLTAAGLVTVQVKLLCGDGILSTFAFYVLVQTGLAPGDSPEHYTDWLTAYLPQTSGAEPGEFLQVTQVDGTGRVMALEGRPLSVLDEHEERLVQLEAQTGAMETALETHAVEAQGMKAGIDGLEGSVAALEQETAKYAQLGNRVNALEEQADALSGLSGQVADLEAAADGIPALGDRVTALEKSAVLIEDIGSRTAELEETLEEKSGEVAQLNDRVAALEGGTGGYPQHWDSLVQSCIQTIRQNQETYGKFCASFAVFSDHHDHGDQAGALIAEVMDACDIPYVFFCGDMVSDDLIDDPQIVEDQIQQFNDMMAPVPREKDCRALGEHDFRRTDSSGNLRSFRDHKLYDRYFRKQYASGGRYPGGNYSYYYVDDPIQKVRFIVLNSLWMRQKLDEDGNLIIRDGYGFGQEQLDWLVNTALDFSTTGWCVAFFAHHPLADMDGTNLRDAHLLKGILGAFLTHGTYSDLYMGTHTVSVDVDFQDRNTAECIGWFSGHTHEDAMVTELFTNNESKPFTSVTIAGSRAEGEPEYAIDFITIAKEQRVVYLTRLGYGESRTFSY